MKLSFLFLVISCFCMPSLRAAEVCALLKNKKTPVAYLSDPKGFVVREGVNLGDIPLSADVDDEKFSIDTKHLLVVSPKEIYVRTPWSGMGHGVDLIPVEPSICVGGVTYRVVLNWVRRKGGVRPYQFDIPFPEFSITDDLGYEEEVTNLYKFKPVLTGRMVSPKK